MDPVSVLQIAGFAASAAKGAVEISKDLYIFYNEARNIDQTVQGLVTEVQALGDACSLVDERLRSIVDEHDDALSSGGPAKAQIWSCVESQVRDSRKTIDQLRVAFQDVRSQGSGVLSQVWRQIKLNTKTRDIGEARNRIRSHTASLQMVLQTVAMQVTAPLIPVLFADLFHSELSHKGDQHLVTLLAKAEECVGHLKALRADSLENDAEQQAREAEILALGEKTVSVAQESLYGASVANASVVGDPAGRSSHVHGWLQDVTAIERTRAGLDTIIETDLHSAISDEPSTVFTDDFRRISTAPTSIAPYDHHRELPSHYSVCSEAEDESEYELLIDAAKDALQMAESCFQATDYKEASGELQEALKIILELPTHQQSKVCDTWEIRHLLSVCAYHTESLEDAKAQLRSVVDYALRESLLTDKQRKQFCEAGHLLGIVCVRLGHLEEGRQYCQSAYDARKKVFGKSHPETYESLALLARVWHLIGNPRRCNIFSRLIPENERQSYLEAIDALIPSGNAATDKQINGPPLETVAEGRVVGPNDSPVGLSPGSDAQKRIRPPISTANSNGSNTSMTSDQIVERDLVMRASWHYQTPEPSVQKHYAATHTTPTAPKNNALAMKTHPEEHRTSPTVPIAKPPDSAHTWNIEATQAVFERLNVDTRLQRHSPENPASPLKDNSTEAARPSHVHTYMPREAPRIDIVPMRRDSYNRLAGPPELDDNASLAPSRIDVDENLLSQIENPAERREIAAMLPQMRSLADTVLHIRRRAHILEQRYHRALPRECIVETNTAERSLALARKYAWSALRPSTRPEVQNAERSIRKATQCLKTYESSLETPKSDVPEPAITKKGAFSKLMAFGSSDRAPQDILIETSYGDIKLRLLDDSKPCKQFASRVQGGSYTDRDLRVSNKGLEAINGDQMFLITPAPTRVLDEKLSLLGYVVEGFELITQTVDAKNASIPRILDCRLTSSADTTSRSQVDITISSTSRKRRGISRSMSDGITSGMNGF